MTTNSKQKTISAEHIEEVIDACFNSNPVESKNNILDDVKKVLVSEGFDESKLNAFRLINMGKIIGNKQFFHALSIIQKTLENIGTVIDCEDYDGLIVKKLPDSDIVSANKINKRNSQTDIRPKREQVNLFPYLMPPKDYMEDSVVFNSLKNYFLFKITVNIYESNLDFLKNKQKSSIDENIFKSHTTVLKDNHDRIEISSQFNLDGDHFRELRNLLYADDYLIFLKKKGKFEYDCFGIKIKDNITGQNLCDVEGNLLTNEDDLIKLNGSYYNLDSITFITEDMYDCPKIGENLLLYGVPGCGKSWTIKNEICEGVDEDHIERVVFHPDYTYSDFIGQILPKVSEDVLEYKFEAGPFTNILKKAEKHKSEHFYLIIEEINRGNAPAIFGDVFQLLDRLKKDEGGFKKGTSEFGVTNSEMAAQIYGEGNEKCKVRIPYNVSIIATMNTSDQNVFTLDTAFKRRWHMQLVENDFNKPTFKDTPIPNTNISWKVFGTAINEIILEDSISTLSSEDKRLGAYFVDEEDLSKPRLFAEKVLMYLWDDVFKFSRENCFKKVDNKPFSLEYFINEFENNQDFFNIFSPRVFKKISDLNYDKSNIKSHDGNENDSK